MARQFRIATSEALHCSVLKNVFNNGPQRSIAAWIRLLTDTDSHDYVLTFSPFEDWNNSVSFYAVNGTDIRYSVQGSITSAGPSYTVTPGPRWYRFVGISRAADSHEVWADGVWRAGSSTNIGTFTGTNVVEVTLSGNSWDPSARMDGCLQHVCAWSRALTPAEAIAFGMGKSPFRIARSALTFYAPLDGNIDIDLISRRRLTVEAGTPDWVPGPPLPRAAGVEDWVSGPVLPGRRYAPPRSAQMASSLVHARAVAPVAMGV